MGTKKAKGGVNRFVVNLGGLQLPEETARQLELDIRKAALAAVATLDFKGDLRIGSPAGEALAGFGATRGIRIQTTLE